MDTHKLEKSIVGKTIELAKNNTPVEKATDELIAFIEEQDSKLVAALLLKFMAEIMSNIIEE